MKKTLIASVYYFDGKNNEENKLWFNLQKRFIKKNTFSYDFAVLLNGCEDDSMFKGCEIIDRIDRSLHKNAIQRVIEYFRANEYDSYCLLDSDCFPISKNWPMKLRNHLTENGLWYASVSRVENGETFPHPAAQFINKEYIHDSIFDYQEDVVSTDLNTGETFRDTGTCNQKRDSEGKMIWYSLLRTNRVNVHPLLCGIYGDYFYHHGMGSRWPKNRCYRGMKIYESYGMKANPKNVEYTFDNIRANPEEFINYLMGKQSVSSMVF